jgi:hypothetical protein
MHDIGSFLAHAVGMVEVNVVRRRTIVAGLSVFPAGKKLNHQARSAKTSCATPISSPLWQTTKIHKRKQRDYSCRCATVPENDSGMKRGTGKCGECPYPPPCELGLNLVVSHQHKVTSIE